MDFVGEFARPVLAAVMDGNYAYAAALALVAVVAALRKWGAPRWDWLASDAGGALLALGASFGGALATAFAAGAAPSWALLWMSMKIAAGGAGVYTLARKLLVAPLRWVAARCPRPVRWVVDLALWLLSRPDSAAEKAARAGDAAVAANPSNGVYGVVGKPREIE